MQMANPTWKKTSGTSKHCAHAEAFTKGGGGRGSVKVKRQIASLKRTGVFVTTANLLI